MLDVALQLRQIRLCNLLAAETMPVQLRNMCYKRDTAASMRWRIDVKEWTELRLVDSNLDETMVKLGGDCLYTYISCSITFKSSLYEWSLNHTK